MSHAGNNYRMLQNDKNELTIEGLSVWNERCCKLNDKYKYYERNDVCEI